MQPARTCLAVVPIRSFANAKSRLAPTLSAVERSVLAQRLAAAVTGALAHWPTLVVTADPEVARWASERDAECLVAEHVGLDAAALIGLESARQRGFAAVGIVPADLAQPEGLGTLLSAPVSGTQVTLVADRHGDGTNLLIVPTATWTTFSYGPGSFARHRQQAQQLGLSIAEPTDTGLELDVDTPADLEEYLTRIGSSPHLGGSRPAI